MKRLGLLLAYGYASFSFAQDPVFTHFGNSEWYVNPSMAARDTMDVVALKYRNQWPGLSGNYQTSIIAYSHHFAKINGTVYGAALIDDAARGTIVTQRYSIGYAQKLKVGNHGLLQLGAEFTYFQRVIDWSKLTYGDMIDPRRGFIYQTGEIPRGGSVSGIDISTGALFQYKDLYIGASLHHITEPDESLLYGYSPLPRKWGLQTGYTWQINSDWQIHPYVWYNNQQGFNILYMMAEAQFKFLVFGGGYRIDDAYTAQLGARFLKFDLLYSYDMTYSDLHGGTAGAHEISGRFKFWNKTPHDNYVEF